MNKNQVATITNLQPYNGYAQPYNTYNTYNYNAQYKRSSKRGKRVAIPQIQYPQYNPVNGMIQPAGVPYPNPYPYPNPFPNPAFGFPGQPPIAPGNPQLLQILLAQVCLGTSTVGGGQQVSYFFYYILKCY